MLTRSPLSEIIRQQREFFATGTTKEVAFRIEQLKRLKQAVLDNQTVILEAVKADLRRPDFEAYAEIAAVAEINYALKHLKSWAKPKRVSVPIAQFPSSGCIYPEPLGVVLIIGAWNYPLQLVISPLIGAIAAGNCAIVKPSEISVNTSRVVSEILQKTFDSAYIAVVEGGVETSQALLAEKFDHIFFTGSTRVGKIVMEAAAKNLTPVTLELGGKSPCIVDSEVNVECAARRIVWGKFLNAGQTCIAPDYLFVQRSVKGEMLAAIARCIREFYGEEPAKSPDYARIIDERQFDRLAALLKEGKIIVGGEANRSDRYIAPTVIDEVSWEAPVMQDEIFGPILPVLEYEELAEAIAKVSDRPKPLALYFFSNNPEKQARVLRETASGTAGINETVMQFIVPQLPFGGAGNSGIGRYHGQASFDAFSQYKSVLKNTLWFDIKLRYAPYTQGNLYIFKKIFGL